MNPELSVIIISYNTQAVTLACLDSLQSYLPENSEVIVVDNASTDGSVTALKKWQQKNKRNHLIASSTNLGFGAGNNLGVREAKGKYILLLNSDTISSEDCFTPCLEILRHDDRIVAVSCNLLNSDGSAQPSGGFTPNLWRLFAWQTFLDDLPLLGRFIKSIHPHYGQIQKDQDRDWLTGAFIMLRKQAFVSVGGFDENIFMYAEELELCYRLKKTGGRIVFTPTASITHIGQASASRQNAITSEIKGLIYFFAKHFPTWQLPLVKFIFVLGSLLRLIIFGIIKNDEISRSAYSSALKDLT